MTSTALYILPASYSGSPLERWGESLGTRLLAELKAYGTGTRTVYNCITTQCRWLEVLFPTLSPNFTPPHWNHYRSPRLGVTQGMVYASIVLEGVTHIYTVQMVPAGCVDFCQISRAKNYLQEHIFAWSQISPITRLYDAFTCLRHSMCTCMYIMWWKYSQSITQRICTRMSKLGYIPKRKVEETIHG